MFLLDMNIYMTLFISLFRNSNIRAGEQIYQKKNTTIIKTIRQQSMSPRLVSIQYICSQHWCYLIHVQNMTHSGKTFFRLRTFEYSNRGLSRLCTTWKQSNNHKQDYYEYWKGLTVENPKEHNRATNCPSYMFAYLIGAQNDENSSNL